MENLIIPLDKFNHLVETVDNLKAIVLKQNQKFSSSERWLDNQEVMQILKVSPRTLQNYRDEGVLSFSQFGVNNILQRE